MNYREIFISRIRQAVKDREYSRKSLSNLSLLELKELSEKLSDEINLK